MIPTRAYGPGGCLSPAAGTGWAGQEQLWQDPKGVEGICTLCRAHWKALGTLTLVDSKGWYKGGWRVCIPGNWGHPETAKGVGRYRGTQPEVPPPQFRDLVSLKPGQACHPVLSWITTAACSVSAMLCQAWEYSHALKTL